MKPTFTLAFALFITTSLTFGQDYQTVRSNDINYYSTLNFDYVLGIKVNSIELNGTDSVFYGFKTIRENLDLGENDPCRYYIGDSWMGKRIEIKSNGQNVFYNRDNEPISIETQAQQGDIFNVYTYSNGDWIKGEVTSVTVVSIFGELDSVKIIDLFSNVPLPINNPRIILSQHHGFIEFFAPYSFPYPYEGPASLNNDHDFPVGYNDKFRLIGFNHTGLTKPTIGDVYNYSISDNIWTYGSVEDEEGVMTETIYNRKVLNKFEYGADSIVYVFQDSKDITVHSINGEEHFNNPGSAQSQMFKHLDQWNTPFMPEEFDGIDGWTSLFINECSDIQEVIRKQGFLNAGSDSCLIIDPYGEKMMYTTINGVGWLEPTGMNQSANKTYMSDLLFYEKMDGNCGTPAVLGYAALPKAEMKVYPNPTDGEVMVEMNCGGDELTVSLVDRSGKLVKVWTHQNGDQLYLDLKELSSGTYTLIVENEAIVTQQNLVKK
ncbi:MAG: T9SS type A sorting domain-containing protein [Crocinitomicaceae bacterium]|nr:T9SS type A sorting domain-containing protein [Crocinitomicaceae bacterium]